jgi:hypothetical protein
MRYLVLVMGMLILGWSLWIFTDDRAGKQGIAAADTCNRVFSDNDVWLDCTTQAWESSEQLKAKAAWGVAIGAFLIVLSGAAIWVRNKDMEVSEDVR